jgi:hypothetical protein
MTDDLDLDYVLGPGERYADDDWSPFSAAERRESLMAYAAQDAAYKRKQQRRELAREIATIKAMQKAGLPVKRAVVDGVTVELAPEIGHAPPPAEVEITTPAQLRALI